MKLRRGAQRGRDEEAPQSVCAQSEYKKLDGERERLSEQYNEVKKELKEYGIIKQNVDSILRVTPGKEQIQEL